MFEAPSRKDIEKIIIDKENVIDDINQRWFKTKKDKKTLNQPDLCLKIHMSH